MNDVTIIENFIIDSNLNHAIINLNITKIENLVEIIIDLVNYIINGVVLAKHINVDANRKANFFDQINDQSIEKHVNQENVGLVVVFQIPENFVDF